MLRARFVAGAIVAAFISSGLCGTQAQALNVVASIKPVHSITAALMQGAGGPQLIIGGVASPHATALKPSQAAALANADLVVWVGPQIETFLHDPLEALADKARILTLSQVPGLVRLPLREGGLFEPHEDAAHDADGHAQNEAEFDGHLWLDPLNARAMAEAIAAALGEADPRNAALYRDNLARLKQALDALSEETAQAMADLKAGRFIVFHDAYQYFEARFGVAARGAITINPDVTPGAQRIGEIRRKVAAQAIDCVFTEPQFSPKIVSAIVDGMQVRTAILDPLGADIDEGPQQYPALIRAIAASFRQCLAPR